MNHVVELVLALALLAIPVSIGIAILRHRLFDIDLIIRRSLVYGGLWLLIGGAYLGLAGALGIAAGKRLPLELAVPLTLAATVVFRPAREALDRLAERLVFGERLSSYELLARFGEQLEHSFDLAELAPRVADAVRRGLDLRWARLLLQLEASGATRLQPAGASGIGLDELTHPEVSMPLVHGGERIGVIECGPNLEGRFSERDHELLGTLARQAALGIHNARLAAELAARLDEIGRQAQELSASRTRIVQAQDAERRRLERNLHDGVQQEIVSLIAKLRLVRNQLGRDDSRAETMIGELQAEARQVLEDLRELAQGIHPAVLSDRGLLDAIEERASRLPLAVRIQADPVLREARFASEIEGAAYFFASEALANALKHASASEVTIRIAAGDRLRVEVEDDGVGFATPTAGGSGLAGLQDRIEALGGSFEVVSRPGSGARLVAELPAHALEASHA